MIINPYNVMYRRFERIDRLPTLASSAITFNGSNQSPTINNYNSTSMVLSGDTSVRDVGDYTITVTPAEGWAWNNGTQDPISFNYSITKLSLAKPYLSDTTKTFNNASQSPTVNDYNSTWENQSGTVSSTDIGSWTVTWSLKEPNNTQWSDESVADTTDTWSIAVLKLVKPTYASGNDTYNGSAKTLTVNNYVSAYMTQSGTTSATNANTYTATYTLNSTTNTTWSDDTTAAVNITWTISRAKLATKPTVKTNPTYSGSAQSPTWNNYNTTYMTIGGTTSATNAGSYTATFTLGSNYAWIDGTTAVASVGWTMQRLKVTKPTVKTNPTYTGSSQSPAWNNYNTTYMTIGGTTAATNAGNYNATFTLKSNWAWSDGGTGVLTVGWTMNRAAGSITLNPTSISTTVGGTATFTVTRSGNGTISVSSNATGVATVSLSSTTVTVTGKGVGSATITVSVAQGTNHNATSKTLTATIKGASLYIMGGTSSANLTNSSSSYYTWARRGYGTSANNTDTWTRASLSPTKMSFTNWSSSSNPGETVAYDSAYAANGFYIENGCGVWKLTTNGINLSGYNILRMKLQLDVGAISTSGSVHQQVVFFFTTSSTATAKTGTQFTYYDGNTSFYTSGGTAKASANFDMNVSALTGVQYLYVYLQADAYKKSGGGYYSHTIKLRQQVLGTQTTDPKNLYVWLGN